MTRIRVNTEEIWAAQKEILAAGLQIAAVAVKLSAIGLLARTYDNNTFGPKVRSICNGSAAIANSIRSSIANSADQLSNYIKKIVAIDEGGVFNRISNWWKSLWNVSNESSGENTDSLKIDTKEAIVSESGQDKVYDSTSQYKEYTESDIINKIEDENGRLPDLPAYGSTDPNSAEQCVAWAKERRLSLGANALPVASIGDDPGAKNYITKYSNSVTAVNNSNVEQVLSNTEPGAALVYDGTSSNKYGHVAVIEAVQNDGVWVSEANWGWVNGVYKGTSCVRFINKDSLEGLYIIPKDVNPN